MIAVVMAKTTHSNNCAQWARRVTHDYCNGDCNLLGDDINGDNLSGLRGLGCAEGWVI